MCARLNILVATGLFLFCAVTAHATPTLYTGELLVKKVSGKACKPTDTGKTIKLELLIDQQGGTVSGYITGPDIMTGRFSGTDPSSMQVTYPFADKALAEGHSIALTTQGDQLTGQLHEKHLDNTAEACNTGTDGSQVSDRVQRQGYNYRWVGENVAMNPFGVQSAMES